MIRPLLHHLLLLFFVVGSKKSSSTYCVATTLIHGVANYSNSRKCNSSLAGRGNGSNSCSRRRITIQRKHGYDINVHNNNNIIGTTTHTRSNSQHRPPAVQMVKAMPIAKTLVRGALLRIASGMTGGTPLECIKSRVTVTTESPWEATRNIISGEDGIQALWTGTPARTMEHALQGALFLVGSTGTKRMILASGGSATMAALCGGFIGGIVQTLIMTPAAMIFTSLNVNKRLAGYEEDNAWSVTRRIVNQKGVQGMYVGIGPMMVRQSTKWATRAWLTELARTQFQMYGLWGELASGVLGGVGGCWNTPVETVRVLMHQDVSRGKEAKSLRTYVYEIVETDGIPGLFRGVTPRCIQAVWLTGFMVVVPNILGL